MSLQPDAFAVALTRPRNGTVTTSDSIDDIPTRTSITICSFWWASITISVSAALFIIVAKGMGSRAIDRSEGRALAEARDVKEFNILLARPAGQALELSKADLSFAQVFELLARTSTAAITLSLILFYLGMVVLVYSANRGIGLGIASIAGLSTILALPCLVYYSRLWAGSQAVRVVESNYSH